MMTGDLSKGCSFFIDARAEPRLSFFPPGASFLILVVYFNILTVNAPCIPTFVHLYWHLLDHVL